MDKKVILLALLDQHIGPLDEVVCCRHVLRVADLLLIDADATTLDQLAELSIALEEPTLAHQQVKQTGSTVKVALGDLRHRHAIEDREERLLIDAAERLLGSVAKEDLARPHRRVVVLARVDHHGDLLSQTSLQESLMRSLVVLHLQRLDLLLGQVGEDPDVLLGILVGDVEPELVELIRRRVATVEPDVAALRLAKLTPVRLSDQRAGDCEGITDTEDATDQLHTGGDIAPLVRAAELETDILRLIEVQVVVSLEELVGEFGEGEPLDGICLETLPHRLLRHHIIDRDVLTDVADEVEEAVVLHPVVVIDQHRCILGIAVEVEKLLQLLLDAGLIVPQRLLIEEVTLLGLTRGVTDHTGSATDEGDGPMTGSLQVSEHHDAHQVTDMK